MAAKKKTKENDGRRPVQRCIEVAWWLAGALDDVARGALLKNSPPQVRRHAETLARHRKLAESGKLNIKKIDAADGNRSGLIAVADQAHRGEIYARAAVLAEHFAELAEVLSRKGSDTIDSTDERYVNDAWKELAHHLGEPRNAEEEQQELMIGLDRLAEQGLSLLDLLGDEPTAEQEKILSLLKKLDRAWKRTKAGAPRTEETTGGGKHKLLARLLAMGGINVAAKTLERRHTKARAKAKQRTDVTPTTPWRRR